MLYSKFSCCCWGRARFGILPNKELFVRFNVTNFVRFEIEEKMQPLKLLLDKLTTLRFFHGDQFSRKGSKNGSVRGKLSLSSPALRNKKGRHWTNFLTSNSKSEGPSSVWVCLPESWRGGRSPITEEQYLRTCRSCRWFWSKFDSERNHYSNWAFENGRCSIVPWQWKQKENLASHRGRSSSDIDKFVSKMKSSSSYMNRSVQLVNIFIGKKTF